MSCYGEKLEALKRYMAKKDLTLEAELDDAVDKLYEKYVPGPVREYISDKIADEIAHPPIPRKRRSKEVADDPSAGAQKSI